MNKLLLVAICVGLAITLLSCGNQKTSQGESREAKALLQGTWMDNETEDVLFQMKGDTVYFSDSTSMPAYFKVVDDTLYIGSNGYHIEKQTDHILCFKNQNGEVLKLEKLDEEELQDTEYIQQPQTTIQTLTEVLKRDTVVFKDGQRYHCYIAINPTHYKVISHTVNEDGLDVDEVYYDNIVNISIFKGAKQIFKRDLHKKNYAQQVKSAFLEKAILNDMNFKEVDAHGFHFIASLCVPNGASCYLVDNIVSDKGEIHFKLSE